VSRPNWFLAFPVDGAFVAALPPAPPRLRVFSPTDVHATLAFLGGCGQDGAERALAVLDARLAELRPGPVAASLAEVVPMGGSRRDYSALSALLDDGRDEMAQLIGALRPGVAEAAAGRSDLRPPKPHVTLARPMRSASGADRQAGLAWAGAVDVRGLAVTFDRIALYTWADDRPAHLFKIVAERPLAGA